MPSPESCQRWIQCHEELIFACGMCPDGLYFDPESNGCNYPTNVDCEMSTGNLCTPGLINRVPAPDSCSQYFQCIGQGDPIEHTCGDGLHFNEELEKCDFIENVRCLREPIAVDCPATDAAFTHEPHPFACDRFFLCINGVATERQCLEGLHFDINLRECQIIDRAQCILDEVEVEETRREAKKMQSVGKEVAHSEDEYQCSDDPFYYKIALPGNCQKYVQCIYGETNIMSCVDGTLFDPVELRCEIADTVTCN